MNLHLQPAVSNEDLHVATRWAQILTIAAVLISVAIAVLVAVFDPSWNNGAMTASGVWAAIALWGAIALAVVRLVQRRRGLQAN